MLAEGRTENADPPGGEENWLKTISDEGFRNALQLDGDILKLATAAWSDEKRHPTMRLQTVLILARAAFEKSLDTLYAQLPTGENVLDAVQVSSPNSTALENESEVKLSGSPTDSVALRKKSTTDSSSLLRKFIFEKYKPLRKHHVPAVLNSLNFILRSETVGFETKFSALKFAETIKNTLKKTTKSGDRRQTGSGNTPARKANKEQKTNTDTVHEQTQSIQPTNVVEHKFVLLVKQAQAKGLVDATVVENSNLSATPVGLPMSVVPREPRTPVLMDKAYSKYIEFLKDVYKVVRPGLRSVLPNNPESSHVSCLLETYANLWTEVLKTCLSEQCKSALLVQKQALHCTVPTNGTYMHKIYSVMHEGKFDDTRKQTLTLLLTHAKKYTGSENPGVSKLYQHIIDYVYDNTRYNIAYNDDNVYAFTFLLSACNSTIPGERGNPAAPHWSDHVSSHWTRKLVRIEAYNYGTRVIETYYVYYSAAEAEFRKKYMLLFLYRAQPDIQRYLQAHQTLFQLEAYWSNLPTEAILTGRVSPTDGLNVKDMTFLDWASLVWDVGHWTNVVRRFRLGNLDNGALMQYAVEEGRTILSSMRIGQNAVSGDPDVGQLVNFNDFGHAVVQFCNTGEVDRDYLIERVLALPQPDGGKTDAAKLQNAIDTYDKKWANRTPQPSTTVQHEDGVHGTYFNSTSGDITQPFDFDTS